MTNYIPELQEYRTVRGWMEDGQDLRALLLAEEMLADACSRLSRRFPAGASALQRVARDARGHVACLEGICVLVTGEVPHVRAAEADAGPAGPLLRRCYGWAMRTLAVYEARSRDREYGPVFARLAAQQQEQCRRILELIGTLRE